MARKKNNRSYRLQVMITPAMLQKISIGAERFDISLSSYAELLLGKSMMAPKSSLKINTQEV